MRKIFSFESYKILYLPIAHLLGNESVITLLRRKGYVVRHIRADEDIPA